VDNGTTVMRIAVGIEYDGRPFCGWQSQASRCAIQDALESAISAVAGEAVTLNAAGAHRPGRARDEPGGPL
jgi:tRNA pseudouridine38-40 synthase